MDFKNTQIDTGDDVRKDGMKYTDYVDLVDFERPDEYNEYFEEAIRFSSSDDWKEQFFSLDSLRRINKFSSEVIDERVMEVHQFIIDSVTSPRSSLNKNALLLIQEIFMVPRSEKLINFATIIAPILEIKSAHEYKVVSTESKFALQYLSASVAFPDVVESLCQGCDSKNLKVKTNSWQAVNDAIQNIDPSHYVTPMRFTVLFETISLALVALKSVEEKFSKKILKCIGKPTVKHICDKVFKSSDDHKVKRIMLVFRIKDTKKATSGGFRKFMKKMKQKEPNPDENAKAIADMTVPIIIN